MIKLTKKEILGLKPGFNKVLVKPSRNIDEYELNGTKKKIYFDPTFNIHENAPVTGEVIAITKNPVMCSSGYVPVIDIIPGDYIIFSFHEGSKNQDPKLEEMVIDVETNELYFFVEYNECYVAKRGDQIIALNHYHVCEPLSPKFDSAIHLPQIMTTGRNSVVAAKVLYSPLRNTTYKNHISPGERVEAGEYIAFDRSADFALEYDIHRTLLGRDKELVVICQRDILATIDDISKVKL